MSSTTLSHAWRFARLFGLTFGGAVLTNLSHLPSAEKTAVLGAGVGALEVAYRSVVPGNPNGIQWLSQLLQAFKVISSVNSAPPSAPSTPTILPASGPAPTGPIIVPAASTPPSPS